MLTDVKPKCAIWIEFPDVYIDWRLIIHEAPKTLAKYKINRYLMYIAPINSGMCNCAYKTFLDLDSCERKVSQNLLTYDLSLIVIDTSRPGPGARRLASLQLLKI